MNRYRINEIKLELGESLESLGGKIRKKLEKQTGKKVQVEEAEAVRISIDSRKGRVIKVVTADFSCPQRLNLPAPPDTGYEIPWVGAEADFRGAASDAGEESSLSRPVIVGFGPCGMFCGLVLARAGLKPIIIERGQDVDSRTKAVEEFWNGGNLNPESNVQFGEGGAGTFSDGKLNTGIKDPRIRFVLETFVEAGADPYILLDARPHIGTDVLKKVVKNIRKEIISLGGEVRFETRLDAIKGAGIFNRGRFLLENSDGQEPACLAEGKVAPLVLKTSKGDIAASTVVLAIGHSARDTVRMLYDLGFAMEPKPFSMGVRVQHTQELIDKGTYGEFAGHPELPPAYYKLSTRAKDGRGVYSFCMCPGGEIVNASSQEGGVVTNGMSNHDRDSGFANSGILVDVRPEDYGGGPLDGIAFQERYEHLAFVNGGANYTLPETTWGLYRDNQPEAAAVINSLPPFVAEDIREAMPVFGRKIKGFDKDDTVIKAIESRSSSPVRILRDRDSLRAVGDICQGRQPDRIAANSEARDPATGQPEHFACAIYPGGEGAGYAGGITSAACDGIKIAEQIINSILSN